MPATIDSAGVSAAARSRSSQTALVLGGNGFLGGYLVAALRAHGWRVLRGIRDPGRALREDERLCDLTRMRMPEDWRDVLTGVDAVVNASGILRERGAQRFATVHVDAPLALARACIDARIRRFVQISALGTPEDGEFIASKHLFDEALQNLPLSSLVLRPSVIYATSGSYGGTSLLRALAALPWRQVLPGRGQWLIDPSAVEDLGELVARAVENEVRGVFEVGGPQPMSLYAYQQAWRRWLRIGGDGAIHVPEKLVGMQAGLWQALGSGPVGETTWRMLRRGNVAAEGAHARLRQAFGFAPRALEDVLAAHPSQVQDRWHAQAYFLGPLLTSVIVLVWVLSARVGFTTPAAEIERLTAGTALQSLAPVALARAGAWLDLALALWLGSGWRPRAAIACMMLSVLAYTLIFGVLAPQTWSDPLGGLLKNLIVLPALAVLWVLIERR
ncbi:MAG: NAD-dependent epimerase/dehydratase family protein [Lysobacteraceae bacterium]|nr:MAG: NAD-dependent epimerase/dehydratase family protein [Xanthomonadaceae bacterium]